MTNPILARQAKRWKAMEVSGKLPNELYEALASGRPKAYERRVVRNLARVSKIISDIGEIRPYEEFSKDWNYDRSVFGHTNKCELCGHAPIVENCVLKDNEGQEILIGNTCVHRYIEIRDPTTGEVLNEEKKAKFLKENMTEAKVEYSKQEFAQTYPNIMLLLNKYERMMHSRKPLKRLHKTVVNRIVKYQYLGAKTRKSWDTFMETAEAEHGAYTAYKKQQDLEARARATKNAEDKAKFAQQIAQNRNSWSKEAESFLATGIDLEELLNDWEKEMVGRVQSKIRLTGISSLRGGYLRFHEELTARHMLANGVDIPMPPIAYKVQAWLAIDSKDGNALNDWEREFCTSIMGRLVLGRSLTDGQIKVVDKINKKVEG